MSQQTSVDLTTLGTAQLAEIQQQLEQEVQHLSESFQKLRQAQAKFNQCAETVVTTSASGNADKEILVPLTSSLYVPGKMADIDTYMVDVGTGYFVEKSAKDAVAYFNGKVATLNKNLSDLQTVVDGKVSSLQAVSQVLQQKLATPAEKSS